MKCPVILAVIFLFGCSTHPNKRSSACCEGLGVDISSLVGESGIDCGNTWATNYWTYGASKDKSKIERSNKKSLSCAEKSKESRVPFIYEHSFESFPDGGYSYFYILTEEGKNVLMVYGSIGDEPFNFYIGYCENIVIEDSGRLSYTESQCNKTTDETLLESIKIK